MKPTKRLHLDLNNFLCVDNNDIANPFKLNYDCYLYEDIDEDIDDISYFRALNDIGLHKFNNIYFFKTKSDLYLHNKNKDKTNHWIDETTEYNIDNLSDDFLLINIIKRELGLDYIDDITYIKQLNDDLTKLLEEEMEENVALKGKIKQLETRLRCLTLL